MAAFTASPCCSPAPIGRYRDRVPDPATHTALAELRNARKRVRTANIDWVDAMYRAYILTIVGVIAVLVASGYVGDSDISPNGLDQLRDHGPAAVGLGIAIAVAIGLRSGARGGYPIGGQSDSLRANWVYTFSF